MFRKGSLRTAIVGRIRRRWASVGGRLRGDAGSDLRRVGVEPHGERDRVARGRFRLRAVDEDVGVRTELLLDELVARARVGADRVAVAVAVAAQGLEYLREPPAPGEHAVREVPLVDHVGELAGEHRGAELDGDRLRAAGE